MKIIIFSDSHSDVDTMCGIVEIEKPDVIIHLGDHIEDADKLSMRYPDIQIYKILGNTDSQNNNEDCIKYIEICGKRIMLTHGHTFLEIGKLKTSFKGITDMFLYGERNNADIMLFGHTHEAFVCCCEGKWIMNPGRIGRISSRIIDATYGVLEIEAGRIQCRFVEIDRLHK